jgi:hypothetical protein
MNTATEYQWAGNRVLAASGKANLFVGILAGPVKPTSGDGNTFLGMAAGANNTAGSSNTVVGQAAGQANTEGARNAFFGALAGSKNTTAFDNAFFGYLAGAANVTGINNAFFGAEAGKSNTASGNAFFGYLAGATNATGTFNALFGAEAGKSNTASGNAFFGAFAGSANTTGFQNVFIGGFAGGFDNTAGVRNTYVGYNTTGPSDLTNATAIGANARVERSNSLVLGNGANIGIGTSAPANILTIQQNSATDPIADAWTTYSSRRWKTNIHTIEDALGKVERLRGVTFDWHADGKRDLGFIAEEVGAVLPELVAYEDNGTDAKSLDYARLTAVLVEAIKEQQRQIEALRAELHRRNTRR